ncbi:MAG: wyosine [tRNA(Phe)-imidazoG37] synthetase (radical SAM superfamily) [Planctomycetota bacterium]|jgi:wyosine [tRNA(Phe)-imidazoG37] synthetase (radical SAM superfamily)
MILQLDEEIVRGPEDHKELGRTLFVRPSIKTPRQNRLASQAVIITAVARRLIELAREGIKLKAVLVEGGKLDPTVHPEFDAISQNLRELLNKHFNKAKLVLVSERPDLQLAATRHAVTLYDLPILRLDAGTQKTFRALTGDTGEVFKTRVESMSRLETERLIVETKFVREPADNSSDSEVRHLLRLLEDIRPAKMRIFTPPKSAAKNIKPVPKGRMGEIAELINEKIGVPVEVVSA